MKAWHGARTLPLPLPPLRCAMARLRPPEYYTHDTSWRTSEGGQLPIPQPSAPTAVPPPQRIHREVATREALCAAREWLKATSHAGHVTCAPSARVERFASATAIQRPCACSSCPFALRTRQRRFAAYLGNARADAARSWAITPPQAAAGRGV